MNYQFPASADATMISDGATGTYGVTYPSLDVGEIYTQSSIRRSLVKFDISDVSGKKISGGTLRLYDTGTDYTNASGTLLVYPVKLDWIESNVSWNKYDGTNTWNTAGAGGADTDYIDSLQGSLVLPNPPVAGYKDVPLSGTIIQAWANGDVDNYGFALYMEGETDNAHLFHAREAGTSTQPYLIVGIAGGGLNLTSKSW